MWVGKADRVMRNHFHENSCREIIFFQRNFCEIDFTKKLYQFDVKDYRHVSSGGRGVVHDEVLYNKI